ncbi:MAG: class D sortase [Acidobacteriota bacterium]
MRVSAWLERLLIVIGCSCLLTVGMSLVRAVSFQRTAAQAFERELAAPAAPELSDIESAPVTSLRHGVIGRLEIPRLGVSMRTTRGIFDYRVIRTEIVAPNDLAVLAPAPINLVGAASFQKTAVQTFEREEVAPAPADLSDRGSASVMARSGLIGRLEIPRLNVSVMVMEGDDDATLARAVGHLRETALPWEPGNAVIAGHRDTFFRPLENVREGDEIRMTTTRGTFDYRVVRTDIVEPDDVSVLAPTPIRSLTLLTCYPFVYVGSAPQRFIIHARSQH